MSPRRHGRCRLLVGLLVLISRATLGAESGESDGGASHAPAAGTHYYAIVGAVPGPATYSSDQSSALLSEIVERAGGMTDAASGGIRIYHHGQQRDQLFVSPGRPLAVPLHVPSGAVIIVERSQSTSDASPDEEFIIACENLLERPVVLGGSPNLLNLTNLLRLLGQSSVDPQSIQIAPRTARLGNDLGIPTGTLLTFDADTIDQLALQNVLQKSPLKDVRPLNDNADQQPMPFEVPEINPQRISELPRDSVSVTRPDESTEMPNAGHRLTSAFVPESVDVPEPVRETTRTLPILEFPVSASAVPAPPVPAPPTPTPAIPAPPTMQPVFSSVESEPHGDFLAQRDEISEEFEPSLAGRREMTPEVSRKRGTGIAVQSAATVPPAVPTSPLPENREETGFGSQVVYAAAAAGGLAMLAMLGAIVWSRRERSILRAHRQEMSRGLSNTVTPTAMPERHQLDLLINNELPVVVEEVALPDDGEFHGRAVGFRYLVHSEQQSLRGPHFSAAARARQTPLAVPNGDHGQPTEDAAADSQLASESGVTDSGAVANRERQTTSKSISPLERALRAQQREKSS